ncbi:MAG TPA: DUF488 domain-containing protein [Verrucomicrobiae bacterium]|nr:DUF488 domain-containing protein [Verrucomicrobiae bacterium]
MADLFTIGHSTHSAEDFLKLLRAHRIDAIGDVRSSPFSAWTPQFNRTALEATLRAENIHYVFLGDELGARREEREVYVEGIARYERIAKLPSFQRGLERVRKGARKFRLALMCAEKDCLECHRTILVCRHLRRDLNIAHIQENSTLESHRNAEARLMKEERIPQIDLFLSESDLIERAYDERAPKIAYRENEPEKDPHAGG